MQNAFTLNWGFDFLTAFDGICFSCSSILCIPALSRGSWGNMYRSQGHNRERMYCMCINSKISCENPCFLLPRINFSQAMKAYVKVTEWGSVVWRGFFFFEWEASTAANLDRCALDVILKRSHWKPTSYDGINSVNSNTQLVTVELAWTYLIKHVLR